MRHLRRGAGCWAWTGQTQDEGGRARLHFNGRYHYAYRLLYALLKGPIAAGQVVRHRCDNPACVRPSHLVIGTQLDNIRDMRERGRADNPGARYAARTHCPAGHPYDTENTYIDPTRGARHCRACRRAQDRRRRRSANAAEVSRRDR